MKHLLILAFALATLPAWASDPGEPLDCSDWVFLEPGVACEMVIPFPCSVGSQDTHWCAASRYTDRAVPDNEGHLLRVISVVREQGVCGSAVDLWRTQMF